MNRIRIGVIGLGHIGKNHAHIFSELADAEFAAVYDSDRDLAQEIATKCRTRLADSIEDFADAIDAATIATPTPTHFEIGMQLLE
ncbi:MAG: Gfo/Idh/MocA family oxidoreductase, partial [Verrucomicrobiota bacterium]|nr:Gfo/Idh/MocA family oxidoreductase [Verrucomicrobiota bacterium]